MCVYQVYADASYEDTHRSYLNVICVHIQLHRSSLVRHIENPRREVFQVLYVSTFSCTEVLLSHTGETIFNCNLCMVSPNLTISSEYRTEDSQKGLIFEFLSLLIGVTINKNYD